jgi:hypothetical protein
MPTRKGTGRGVKKGAKKKAGKKRTKAAAPRSRTRRSVPSSIEVDCRSVEPIINQLKDAGLRDAPGLGGRIRISVEEIG